MGWMFELKDGRRVALSGEAQGLMAYVLPVRRGGVLLSGRYESGLACEMYGGTVCFSYVDREGNVIFDRIGEGRETVVAKGERAEELRLVSVGEELFLFWTEHGDSYSICGARLCAGGNICEPAEPMCIYQSEEPLSYVAGGDGDSVIILACSGINIMKTFRWNDGSFVSVQTEEHRQEKMEWDDRLARETGSLQEENDRLAREVGNLQDENDRLVREAGSLQEENSGLAQEVSGLQEDIHFFQGQIEEYEKGIGYAKERYDELAEYARRLQTAVREWKEWREWE